MATIYVGISGGVDSAVAASLLVEQGHSVVGVFMKNWTQAFGGVCPWREDRRAALRVAAHLGIPLYTWNFEEEYARGVMEYFFGEYAAGRTPNPDVLCNSIIKFAAFYTKARARGADAIATGHYAAIRTGDHGPALHIPADTEKDQTYFLSRIDPGILAHVRFPLQDMTKEQVRAYAMRRHLPSARRPDSQGICFVGEVPVREFLASRLPKKSGTIISTTGTVLGTHEGAHLYTIGQRSGLGVAPNGIPHYVVAKDVRRNTVTVAAGPTAPELYAQRVFLEQMHWFGEPAHQGATYTARLRYRQEPAPCTVVSYTDHTTTVEFAHPQRAVTPGQFCVLYDGTRVVGSGILIEYYEGERHS